MTFPILRRLGTVAVLVLAAGALRAEPAIIAKARAFVGTEEAINAVKSIHYVGSLVTPDPTDAKKLTYVTLDLILQSPYQQRSSSTSDRSVETTGLDGYDAWHRVGDPKDPKVARLQIVGKDKIRQLRANTWENLSFYRGLEREGGKVVDLGEATADGVKCQKIGFMHAGNLAYFRYFELATGRLVLTENEAGTTIRERGEIRVNGVRFPKSILNTVKTPDGKELSVTITFDKVTVNESFPASTFAIPSLVDLK